MKAVGGTVTQSRGSRMACQGVEATARRGEVGSCAERDGREKGRRRKEITGGDERRRKRMSKGKENTRAKKCRSSGAMQNRKK